MFSRPKILFLVSLLFVALLNPKFNPYLLFKFLIFYHSYKAEKPSVCPSVRTFLAVSFSAVAAWIDVKLARRDAMSSGMMKFIFKSF